MVLVVVILVILKRLLVVFTVVLFVEVLSPCSGSIGDGDSQISY